MFRVFIEGNNSFLAQYMEIAPDVPIVQIMPALLEQLHLPQNDFSGNCLIYFLSHAADGRVLPEHFSLRAAGIQTEDHLKLVSYVAEKKLVAAITPTALPTFHTVPAINRSTPFYSDTTLADSEMFTQPSDPDSRLVAPSAEQLSALPVYRARRSRRAFLLVGSVAVGAGLAYAGLRALSNTSRMFSPVVSPQMPGRVPTTGATLPTHVTSQFVFTQHQQSVRSVSWSPDGTALASGANDHQLLVWGRDGQVRFRQQQNEAVHAVAWSPDGHHLAIASGNEVLFLNAGNGVTEARFPETHHATVTTLAWSTQQPQMLVSAGLDKLAVVWNTRPFQPQTFFRQHTASILAAGWASDGRTVGSTSLGGVTRIWDSMTGQQVHGFYFEKAISMSTLAFAPAGTSRLVVGGNDGSLRLWSDGLICQQMGNEDMQGQCLDKPQHFAGHTGAIRASAWSPDGRLLASAGDDGQLLLWNPAQNQTPLLKIQQHAPILALSWSPDGKHLASASGNAVTLWALS